MRHRDARIGRNRDRRANAGNDFERNTGAAQSLNFFSTASEDERIPAFQADDFFSRARMLDQQRLNRGLLRAMPARFFADNAQFCRA